MRLAVAALLTLLHSPLNAQPMGRLIDGVIAAYGGPTALEKLVSYRLEGQVTGHLRGVSGRTVRRFKAPETFRVELDYGSFSELRILASDAGWRGADGRLVLAQGPLLESMRVQMLRSDVPGVIGRYRDRLVDWGEVELDGRKVRLLRLDYSEAVTLNYWVDPKRHLVLRAEGQLSVGGMTMSFTTLYSDFREINGVIVAGVEENWAGTSHVATTRIEKLVFETHDPTLFAP